MLTEEQIVRHNHIPDEEVRQDIKDSEREIRDMQDELNVLMRNPPQHKVRIYFLEGGLSQRRRFVEKLQQILEYREQRVRQVAATHGV